MKPQGVFMKKSRSLCEKRFTSLVLTASFAMAIEYLMLLSDSIIIGNMLGEAALAGLNIVTPLFSIVVFVGTVISVGTTVCYSFEMGKLDKDAADRYFGQGIITAVGAGIILFMTVCLIKDVFLGYYNPSPEIYSYAEQYYRYFKFVALVMPIYVTLVDTVYCDGDELICNLSYVLQVGGNILSSVLLCRVIGIAGVSLGSVIGCVLSMSVLIIHFLRKCSSLRFVWFISLRTIFDVIKFSIVDAGMYLFLAIQLLVFNKLIIHNFGSEYLPVLTVVASLVEMTVIFDGLGQALEPLVAVYNGEGNTKGITSSMKIAGKLAVIEGIAATVLVLIFAGLFVRLFGVSDPVLAPMAKTAVRIAAFSMPFAALCFLFTSYFLYMKRIGLAFFISMLNNLILPLLLAVPMGILAGINGIWAGIMLSYILTVACGALIVYRIKGKLTFPLLLDPVQNEKVCIFDARITEKEIIDMRNRAEALLREKKVQDRTIMNVMLIIEDACLLIGEKNKGKTVTCECTLITDDEITMILRDDGVIFDITDVDADVSSLRQYVVAGIMEKQESKRYLKTSGLNRNVFRFEG